MRRVVTEEEKKKSIEDYVSGMNVYDIARKYHFRRLKYTDTSKSMGLSQTEKIITTTEELRNSQRKASL